LTDPSYYGQIITQTFPLIGNYGVIPEDFESREIHAKGYIVKQWCRSPSNFRNQGDLDSLLKERGIVGLEGIDTRSLTRLIRENGVLNGQIVSDPSEADVKSINSYSVTNAVKSVSCVKPELYPGSKATYKVALMDFGVKNNIIKELLARESQVTVWPSSASAESIIASNPDGIMLTNGPGDPAENTEIIQNLSKLLNSQIPIFGICLGHQLLALAAGGKTTKLKYGHRGANQPVRDLSTSRVYITSQNHGYAVLADSVPKNVATEGFVNCSDGTCEGMNYLQSPAFTVQFHPEACGGPQDTSFLFDRFVNMMEVRNAAQ
jgi:carbamoyl-phosphate synthase small subunit